MWKFKWFLVLWLCINALAITTLGEEEEEKGSDVWDLGSPFVKREERRSIISTVNGEVSSARVSDGANGYYLLHFITLEPNSLFLPVLLQADMVFYVHSGIGRLGWNEEDEMRHANVKKGDVFRLPAGTVFFAQSNLESSRQKLQIHVIFANSINDLREPTEAPYTSIRDLVFGFDKDVLQAAFSVPGAVIEEMLNGANQPLIIHGHHETEQTVAMWDKQMEYVKQFVGKKGLIMSVINKKKKVEEETMYNILEEDKDFENCNGWSSTVTSNNLDSLKGSDIGIFMVNLTKGSMMGPHWNPMATEIAIVLEGQGIVRVVCLKTSANVAECRNMRFFVNEGDVFVVPRFHPMAQMAFNNGSFVFMGFSTSAKNNHPQFLVGKASVFRTLNVDVVAASFNVGNATITQLFDAQDESVILECVSCAEEELRVMEEEARKAEEERSREEEEAREREEEKARKEEEERKQREEEEARRKEEEERKRREEEAEWEREEKQRKQEEEEARREEEERKQREEEEARRKEEEEERKKQEEEEQRREEEAARKREEEEEEEEEEEQRKQDEEAQRKKEEEEAQREEEERKQREEAVEEEERKGREEEQREQEEEARRKEQQKEEEEARKKEEEAQREEEERQQREEEARRQKEETRRQKEETRKREEREARRQREEEAAQEEQEQARRAEEAARRAAEEADKRASEEAKRTAEELERERRQREPEEGRGGKGGGGGRRRREGGPQEGR